MDSWVPLIVALVGGGGIIGAIVAFLKVRPEAGQIAVTASQGALIVQTGVIETLRGENTSLRNRLEDVESRMALLVDLRERVQHLEFERRELKAENARLRNRVTHLEKRLRSLGQQVDET